MVDRRRTANIVAVCVLATAIGFSMAGCGKSPDSPKQQESRVLKAAGVRTFVIECSEDLWKRTNGSVSPHWEKDDTTPIKVDKGPDKTVTVTLSGPEMVKYLRTLDYAAHGGVYDGGTTPDIDGALATRMYDAIAPVVDDVSKTPDPGLKPPVIKVDDKPGHDTADR